MQRFLRKVLEMVSILIVGYQQFCYADVIVNDPVDDIKPIIFLIGFIGIIILIISAISFFSLKATIKKQNTPGFDSEKLKTISTEEFEKKNNRIQRRLYMWGMILAIIGLLFLAMSDEISAITFFIPIILFIISFIIRLNKKKKISNIICAISVVLVCLIGAWVGISNKIIENYNKQFLQYQKGGDKYISRLRTARYVSDIEGLINTAINNNKSGRKTTIIYKSSNYTSPEELRQLLSKININKNYNLNIKYDKNYNYIESITLLSYEKGGDDYDRLAKYLGTGPGGSIIRELIQEAMSLTANDLRINVVYTSETGQKTTVNLNTDSSEKITNLKNEFKEDKTYRVYLQTDYEYENIPFLYRTLYRSSRTIYVCNIIITDYN